MRRVGEEPGPGQVHRAIGRDGEPFLVVESVVRRDEGHHAWRAPVRSAVGRHGNRDAGRCGIPSVAAVAAETGVIEARSIMIERKHRVAEAPNVGEVAFATGR